MLQFPIECSDCGHLEPDGACEVCRPNESSPANVPSTADLLTALRVVSHWQLQIRPHGEISMVEDFRTDTEAAIEHTRQEVNRE